MTSRRAFVRSSATAALSLLAGGPGRLLLAAAPGDLLPEPDDALLRELALKAVEAARAAGASFADVRLGTGRSVNLTCRYQVNEGPRPVMSSPILMSKTGYGVRAIVNGTWGFASGYELTPDAVALAARTAADVARANRPRHRRTLELAPAGRVEHGTWATPIAQDPFTVSIREQAALGLAAVAAAAAVPGATYAICTFGWQRTTRVFASTDGSLLVQSLDLALPDASAAAWAPDFDVGSARVESLRRGGYGFEAIGATTLVEELRRAAERAVEARKLRRRPKSVEVGRYDLVVSGTAMADLLVGTLAAASNLELALGYRVNQEGSSFAAPPDQVLGTYQVGAKLLTLRGERSHPHAAATVGWDDEGVQPEPYTFIEDGIIVDYHTNRQTAAALADWYRRRGEPLRSHGCAMGAGQLLPMVRFPNLAMQPGAGNATVEDLIAGTKRGFYIEAASGGSDQQVLNCQFGGRAREITNGKLGEGVKDFAFQFITPQFWKSLDALGGPASATAELALGDGRALGDPLQLPYSTVSAVPARFRQVNVLNIGRTA